MDKKRLLIYLLVFISGLAVMAIEMAASRILVPYFGNSLFVWANIIGVVMAALALGYFLGGRIADRHPGSNPLMLIVLTSGVFSTLIPLIYKPVIIFWLKGLGYERLILSSLFSTLILFALPIALLGFVSPFSIRLLAKDVGKSGRVSGAVYSLGTVGSILGTFLSSFFMIPFWGSRETIIFSAFLLILTAVISLFLNRQYFWLIFLMIPVIVYFFTSGYLKDREDLVYEKESPHQLIQIFNKDDRLLLSYNEGFGVQSVYDSHTVMTDTYYDFFSLAPFIREKEDGYDVLIVGHGGGTASRQLLTLFADKFPLSIDAIEIDKEVTKAAEKYFDLDNQEINIYNTDGRTFLNFTEKKYDFVVIDAFNNRYNIPFHLTTQEFFKEIKDRMNQGGIIMINFVVNSELKEWLAATLKSVFNHVYFTEIAPESWNQIIFVSDESLDFKNLKERVYVDELKETAEIVEDYVYEAKEYNSKKILTDNKAPIEIISPKI